METGPGRSCEGGHPTFLASADANGDGRINALDLAAVKQRLNSRLPEPTPQAVPPAAPSLLRASSPTRELFAAAPVLA